MIKMWFGVFVLLTIYVLMCLGPALRRDDTPVAAPEIVLNIDLKEVWDNMPATPDTNAVNASIKRYGKIP